VAAAPGVQQIAQHRRSLSYHDRGQLPLAEAAGPGCSSAGGCSSADKCRRQQQPESPRRSLMLYASRNQHLSVVMPGLADAAMC
jgi:hypothetical protein